MQSKTIDIIWVDGQLLKLNQPTIALVREMENVDDNMESVVDIVLKIVNNNTSAKKFQKNQIENLSLTVLKAIVQEVANFKVEADNHPN